MEKIRIFYNPLSHDNRGYEDAKKLEAFYPGASFDYTDVTPEGFSYRKAIEEVPEDEKIVLTGGDGTINRIVNDLGEDLPLWDLLYYPAGTGNDFVKDLKKEADAAPFLLNPYIARLPKAAVNGRIIRFINGAGLGIDAFSCAEHERLKEKGKGSSYILIALKGLLGAFKPFGGTVTVDGEPRTYKKIWMVPVMNGSYFGGGFRIAPHQDRLNEEGTLTSVEVHDVGRLKAMILFLPAMLGKGHLFPKHITFRQGKHIEVTTDRKVDLQYDGEVLYGVDRFTVDI